MAATVAESHTASPRNTAGKAQIQDPAEFLSGLMRDLGIKDSVFEQESTPAQKSNFDRVVGSPVDSTGSTIELTEDTQSFGKSEPLPAAAQQSWNKVIRRARGVHNAKKQWQNRSGIKPLEQPLTGPNGEPLSPEEYSTHRLQMRCRELVGRTIEGELIPREKGKGYFIKWNRWRHDRVFMSAATIESVLGPIPKPGTMIRCTIVRLGPDHVPWNRQNPVSNHVEHWYIRPSGFMYPQPNSQPQHTEQEQRIERPRSYSKQQWEYAGVTPSQPEMGYAPQQPVALTRSRSGSLQRQSPTLMSLGHEAFAGRTRGRAERAAGSWRSPQVSRQGTESSLEPLSLQNTVSRQGTGSSLGSLNSIPQPSSEVSSRFQRPITIPNRTSSLGALLRSSTGSGSQPSHGSR